MTPYLGPPAPLAPYVDAAAVAEESRYVICSNCDTEVLRSDNYCFHCGEPQNAAFRQPPRKVVTTGTNAWLYMLALILLGANLGFRHAEALGVPELAPFHDYTYYGSAGAGAVALIVWAFFRRRRFLNQAIAVVYFILALAVLFGL
ncbi:MAG: zinc ribbon domain-containing protein [Candidatus Sumerlaeota bacterium]|nr:zinc ribbon domain-containing protein [Candidatus Sumerlaeota bacterium]